MGIYSFMNTEVYVDEHKSVALSVVSPGVLSIVFSSVVVEVGACEHWSI